MRAEVIAIGDELTCGVRLDTNSQWLSWHLEQLGISVAFHTTVGDDMEAMVPVFRTAIERVDVAIITGGLGPTADDLTRQALAELTQQTLVMHPDVLAHIRALFLRRGRVMPQRNEIQAYFPKGATVIANPHGTAPGIYVPARGNAGHVSHLFALPGVPAEMKQMWTGTVAPKLVELPDYVQRVIQHRTVRCFGAGESDIEQRLPDLVRRGRQPSVGITASRATISLRVTAKGESADECQQAMEPTIATIYECLGDLIFGEDDDTLQAMVCRLLHARNMSLATAEWGTRGKVAAWLADEQAADAYRGGMVVSDSNSLQASLGVTMPVAPPRDEVSSQLVADMARQVSSLWGADLGLAVGPNPPAVETPDRPGRIHFSLAVPGDVIVGSSIFAAHPSIQRERAAKEALNLVRLWLIRQA